MSSIPFPGNFVQSIHSVRFRFGLDVQSIDSKGTIF
jgi:hypothetical protein